MDTLLDPRALLGRLGSFWSTDWGGASQLFARLDGTLRCAAGLRDDLDAAADATGRSTVRAARPRRWLALPLRADERGVRPPTYAQHDRTYGSARLTYGAPAGDSTYPAPGLLDALAFVDNPETPTRLLVRGVDFEVDPARAEVRFTADPLADPAFNPGGGPEAVAWAYRAGVGPSDVPIWAEPLAVPGPGTAAHRDVADAVGRALVGGTSVDALYRLLAAVADAPIAAADGRVLYAARDDDRPVVVTESDCYLLGRNAVAPSAGTALHAGEFVGDAVAVHHLRNGIPAWLSALVLPRGFFPPGLCDGGIGFENREVPLEVGGLREGRRFVRFDVLAAANDRIRFFDRMHANGVNADGGLATLLDARPNPVDEPTAASLPATVNPLGLATAMALRGNLLLIRLRPDAFGPNAAGTSHLRLIRRLVPPRAAALVIVDLPAPSDAVSWDSLDALPAPTALMPELGDVEIDPCRWDLGREPFAVPC